MKKIAVDARLAGHPGIGRYTRSLLEAMLALNAPYKFVLIGDPSELASFAQMPSVEIRPCHVPIYSASELLSMHKYFEDADLTHVPHFNVPLRTPKKLVVTIHDLIYFRFPAYEPFWGARLLLGSTFRRVAKKASRIIAVSNATLEDFGKAFGARDKCVAILEAADPLFSGPSASAGEAALKYGFDAPYILSVGSIREHKNIRGLLDAYERATKKGMKANLILAGGLDERFERKHGLRERLRRDPSIRHLGRVSDTDLKALYEGAACFVMPSFYEGFGLPVLEAMACGAPVILSSVTSLPEVGGDAALYFEPRQIDRLSELLYNVLSDNNLRKNLASKGREQVRLFSWEKTARETLKIYEQIL